MNIQICGAPCCWGVDDPKNPYLPPWERVLAEAGMAGYSAIELGPYGYLPIDAAIVAKELKKNNLAIVAGTIFHDLLSEQNQKDVLKAVDEICALITDPCLPKLKQHVGQKFAAPYLTVMDWGHDERDYAAGHPDTAPRLSDAEWTRFIGNVRAVCERANQWGVRPVIHPHAGSYIEFADEIEKVVRDIPYEIAGLCLDTGHLYYSHMDPVTYLKNMPTGWIMYISRTLTKRFTGRCWANTSAFSTDAAKARCARSGPARWTIRRSSRRWPISAMRAISPSSRNAIRAMRIPACVTSRQAWTI